MNFPNLKKPLSLTLSAALLAGMMTVPTHAAGYADTDGHWAEHAIDRWSGYGIAGGMPDGSFQPDASLTRAQLAQMAANLLGLPAGEEGAFSDVDGGAWYAQAVNACAQAGVVSGFPDGSFQPDQVISREQSMVILCAVLGLEPLEDTSVLDRFPDADSVAPWAAGYVAAMVAAGHVGGTGNGVEGAADVNRASVLTILNSTVSTYVNEAGTYDLSGTPENGVVLVVADEVVLTGTCAGGVLVAQGSSKGSVTLQDAQIEGSVTITGEAVSLAVTGESSLASMTLKDTALNTEVTVDQNASVAQMTSQADNVSIQGQGKVEQVTVQGNNTAVDTAGTKVEVDKDVTGTTSGGDSLAGGSSTTTPPASTTPPANGGGTGGSGSGGGSVHFHSYTHGVCVCGEVSPEAATAADQEQLIQALAGEADTIVLTGSFTVTSPITIARPVTLNGNGKTVTAGDGWDAQEHGYLLNTQEAGGDITIVNLVLDSASIAGGVRPHTSGEHKLILDSVTLRNSKGAGLTVNGSTVEAAALTIEGSAAGQSIDVSQGLNSSPSSLTLDQASGLKDAIGIAEDSAPTASVTVGGVQWKADGVPVDGQIKYVYAADAAGEDTISVSTPEALRQALAAGAESIRITATLGSDEAYTAYTVSHPAAIQAAQGVAVYGSFAVNTDGAAFEGLTVINPGQDTYGEAFKNAITAYTKDITISNCTFQAGAEFANGVVLFPSAESVNFNLTGNTFQGYNNGDGSYSTTALMITGKYDMSGKPFLGAEGQSAHALNVDDRAMMDNNTFTGCANDYVRNTWASSEVVYAARNYKAFSRAAENAVFYFTDEALDFTQGVGNTHPITIVLQGVAAQIDAHASALPTHVTLELEAGGSLTAMGTAADNQEELLTLFGFEAGARVLLDAASTATLRFGAEDTKPTITIQGDASIPQDMTAYTHFGSEPDLIGMELTVEGTLTVDGTLKISSANGTVSGSSLTCDALVVNGTVTKGSKGALNCDNITGDGTWPGKA